MKQLAPRPVKYFAQVDTTNDIAMQWLRDGAPTGAVVIADEQRKGKGRHGRTWQTPPGVALAMSVVLHPPAQWLSQTTMLSAVAVAELCEHVAAPDVSIKWPNDVLVAGRKVCGILSEVAWEGNRLVGVVTGIGVNVRIDFSGSELQDTAISLEHAVGRVLNRLDLLDYLLARIDHWAARVGTDVLFEAWRSRMTIFGQLVRVESANEVIAGIAEKVEPDGTLYIRKNDGTLFPALAGDVSLRQER